jgi:single-stranded DNA-specific DHH superfamily exonuclease
MKKKDVSKSPKTENVAVTKEQIEKLRKHKEKTGCSIIFFVAQAIDNELKRVYAE